MAEAINIIRQELSLHDLQGRATRYEIMNLEIHVSPRIYGILEKHNSLDEIRGEFGGKVISNNVMQEDVRLHYQSRRRKYP